MRFTQQSGTKELTVTFIISEHSSITVDDQPATETQRFHSLEDFEANYGLTGDLLFIVKHDCLSLSHRLTTLSRDNFFHTYVDVVGNIKLSNGHQKRPIPDSREHGQGPVEGYRGTRLLKIAVGSLTEVYKCISSYQSSFQSNIMLCIGSRFTVDQDGAGVT
uniref:Uncharacterized protein n=1 Tax=Brassica campestris TaxID=3711 RepID=M4F1G0_BRACM